MDIDRLNSIWIKMLPYVERVLRVRGEYDQDLVSDTYLQLYDGRQNIQDESDYRVAWYAISIAETLIIQRPGRYNRVREIGYNDNRRYPDRSLTDSDKKHIDNMMEVVLNAFDAIKKNGRTDYRYKDERRRVMELYLQGYTFTEIAGMMNKTNHMKPIGMLWNTIRDIQKQLGLPISDASRQSGILMRHARPYKNSYLEQCE